MRHLLVKTTAAALALTALITVVSVAVGADTAADPLISLSYLNGKYRSDLLSEVDTKVTDVRKQLSDEFAAQLPSLEEADSAAPAGVENDYRTESLRTGKTVQLSAAGELLLISGEAKVTTAGLIDATAGETVSLGASLSENHLYLAIGDCTVQATKDSSLLIK